MNFTKISFSTIIYMLSLWIGSAFANAVIQTVACIDKDENPFNFSTSDN